MNRDANYLQNTNYLRFLFDHASFRFKQHLREAQLLQITLGKLVTLETSSFTLLSQRNPHVR